MAGRRTTTACDAAGIYPVLGAAEQQIGEINIRLRTKLAEAKPAAALVEPAALHTPPQAEVGGGFL